MFFEELKRIMEKVNKEADDSCEKVFREEIEYIDNLRIEAEKMSHAKFDIYYYEEQSFFSLYLDDRRISTFVANYVGFLSFQMCFEATCSTIEILRGAKQ